MVQLYGRVGGEVLVNTTTAEGQSQPAMARLASGEYVVVWVAQSAEGPGQFEINGQLHAADGTPIGGEFKVSGSTGNRGEPRVAALSTGGFVVTWSHDLHDGDGTNPQALFAPRIRGQLFDADANKVGGELVIGPDTTGDHIDSQVIGLPNGAFAVSWTLDTLVNNVFDRNVVALVFDAAGVATSPLINVAAATPGFQFVSALAALPGGGFVAAWADNNPGGLGDTSNFGVKAQLFDSAGAKVGSEFLVNTTTALSQSSPSVAVLDSGGFVITWADTSRTGGDTEGQSVRAQRFDASGAKVGVETLVNTTTAGDQFLASVAGLPGGGFVVAWRDGTAFDANIKAQAFDSAGAKAGIEFAINTFTEGLQSVPFVMTLADGGFAIAWTDRGGSDGSLDGVKAQLFTPISGPATDLLLSSTMLGENAVENEAVATIAAVGAANSSYSYELVADSSGGAFRLEGDRLVVADNAKLDFETAPQVTVTIRATDINGQSYEEAIVLDVTDVYNERRYAAEDAFLANVGELGLQGGSTLVPLAGGSFAVIWLEYWPGTADAINPTPARTLLRLFDSTGAPVSGEIVLATKWLQGIGVEPLISGGFLIVREAYHEPSGVFSVKAQAYDDSGNPVGPEITAGSTQSGFPRAPSAVQLASGDYVISWATPSNDVLAQRFDANGTPMGGEIPIASAASVPISLAATSSGGFAAGWLEEGATESEPSQVKVQLYGPSGAPVGDQISVDAGTLGAGYVDLLALADGSLMLTWVETVGEIDGFPVNAVMAQPIDMSGAAVGGPVVLTVYAQEPDYGPPVSFAVHPDGGFVAMWPMIDFSTGAITYTMFAQQFDNCGCPIGSPFRPAEMGEGGDIATLFDGTIVTTWTGFDSDDRGVLVKLYRAADGPFNNDGDDLLYGDGAGNLLDGGLGDDQLYGLDQDDDLLGGIGNDILDGGAGADTMTGGDGNDVYVVDDRGDIVAELAGEGIDEIRTDLAVFSLEGLPDVENLVGTAAAGQTLTGNANGNTIYGGPGKDLIALQAGGDDIVFAGGGNDVLYFGAAFTGVDQPDGGEGRDVLVLQGDYVLTLGDASLAGIESLSLQSGANPRWGDTANNAYDYDITMAEGNVAPGVQLIVNGQSLLAGEDFRFDGSAEHDGKFLVFGGRGVDTLTGGDGNDLFVFEGERWGAGDSVDGGGGRDAVVISAGNGVNRYAFGEASFANIEAISVNARYASDPSQKPSYELILANGNVTPGGNLIVNGSSIVDPTQTLLFDGSAVADGTLTLYAGAGNDTLIGGDGADLLHGAGGEDSLTGGDGADTFQYRATSESTAADPDSVLDFQAGVDRIDLHFIDANTLADGDQAFTWIGSNAFGGTGAASAGELRAYESAGTWFVEGDADGDGIADLVIAVTTQGGAPLGQGDFIL